MSAVGNAALVGSLAVIGGGVVGVLAGSIARGNLSDGINDGLAPVAAYGLFLLGAGTTGFAGWAALDMAKGVAPGLGQTAAKAGAIGGVAALAALAGYGGFQMAMHD